MAEYMTGQRRELLAFLAANPDRQFTAGQIADGLGESVSRSAVYRNLAWLGKAGVISRMVKDGRRDIYYQYVADEHCRDCLHLTCMKCGRTFHMDNGSASRIMNDLSDTDGFSVDKTKTVIYGVCKKCN